MKKIGLKDVANSAGVSISLVSYVLNGQAVQKKVKKETAKRIIEAANNLNYKPDLIAKSLKMSKTHSIGLIVADIDYRYTSGITKAIEEEAKRCNYTVIYGSSNERRDAFVELINVFTNRRVDGLIIIPVEGCEDQLHLLQGYGIPYVLVDRLFKNIDSSYIGLDNFQASYNATEYLIKLGHKKIFFCNYHTTLFHLQERNRGYKKALLDYKIKFKPDWLIEIPNIPEDRYENVTHGLNDVFEKKKECDAVFFASDNLAICGLKYFIEKQIRIPDDVSVMSFDEYDEFEIFYCSITHSRQPLKEMGTLAVKTLVNLIEKRGVGKHITLKADLVAGKSCKEGMISV
ncbi:LacI family transcriptional regulator [Terrimonas sp.]|uniref:LacI family DNA-binding transcriptional regulator n=1 Tax=Terrimonas sp. TaxID=1914338 RepID=UPI000D52446F|nr:LacI family DNA-binding transcriptional regulator [Terrimonas sp.]PVD52778.1 LacI family transcriptional regulator [Terrimonas sp.]